METYLLGPICKVTQVMFFITYDMVIYIYIYIHVEGPGPPVSLGLWWGSGRTFRALARKGATSAVRARRGPPTP